MDGISNVATQQTTQPTRVASTTLNSNSTSSASQMQTQTQQKEQVKLATMNQNDQTQSTSQNRYPVDTKEQVQNLVDDLNKAIEPMNTSIKFGVDENDVFYVSVIDQKTDQMIRRFPAEKAADFLPKMQEVTGLLFDSKG